MTIVEHHHARDEEGLAEARRALAQRLDVDGALSLLLDYLGRLVPFDTACVLLREGDRLATRAERGCGRIGDEAPRETSGARESAVDQALANGTDPILVRDALAGERWPAGGADQVRCWIGVPLVALGEVIGYFAAGRKEPDALTEEDLGLARDLAPAAAAAVHAALMMADLRGAAELSRQVASERKRAEEALRASEASYRDLVESIRDLVCTHDLFGNIRFANSASARLLGYTPQDLSGMNIRQILTPETRDQFDAYAAAIQRDGIASGLMSVRTKGGETRLWEYRNVLRAMGPAEPVVHGVARDVTEERRIEAKLRQNEASLQAAQARAHLGSYEFDVAARSGRWSAELYRLFGRDPDRGAPGFEEFLDLVHPEDREAMRDVDRQASGQPGVRLTVEYRSNPERCPARRLEATVESLADKDGRVAQIVGTVLDITERHRAAEDLRRQKHFVDHILDAEPGTVYIYDLVERRNVFVNREWLKASGYTEAETKAMGSEFFALVFHPDDLQRIAEHQEGWRGAEEETREIETRVRTKTGEWLWIQSREVAFSRDASGAVTQILGVAHDVTERKRAEASVRESEERLRTLFEQASDGIFVTDPEGRVFDANSAGCRVLGYTRDELLQLGIADFVTPEEVARVAPEVARLRSGDIVRSDWTCRRKDGSVFPGEVTAQQLRDGRMQAFLRDVTERKRAEEALVGNERRSREMAQRLRTLSRRLLAAQEDERRRIARELHDEIGQVLTVVKLDLQSLQRLAGAEPFALRLSEGIESIDRGLQEVRNMALDLRPSILDDLGLAAALRWFVDRHTRGGEMGAHLMVDPELSRVPPEVETACFRIAQEALTNVVRHSRASQLWLELRLAGDDLELAVRDDGVGFEPMEARARAVGGSSMGLLGMEERASLAGGVLEVRSRPGGGTEVRARFPVSGRTTGPPGADP